MKQYDVLAKPVLLWKQPHIKALGVAPGSVGVQLDKQIWINFWTVGLN